MAETFAGHFDGACSRHGRVAPHKPMVDNFQTPGGRELEIRQVTDKQGIGLTVDESHALRCFPANSAWTPGTNEQAWDRVHQDHANHPVCEIPVLTFPHAVEERVIRTNPKKAIFAHKCPRHGFF